MTSSIQGAQPRSSNGDFDFAKPAKRPRSASLKTADQMRAASAIAQLPHENVATLEKIKKLVAIFWSNSTHKVPEAIQTLYHEVMNGRGSIEWEKLPTDPKEVTVYRAAITGLGFLLSGEHYKAEAEFANSLFAAKHYSLPTPSLALGGKIATSMYLFENPYSAKIGPFWGAQAVRHLDMAFTLIPESISSCKRRRDRIAASIDFVDLLPTKK